MGMYGGSAHTIGTATYNMRSRTAPDTSWTAAYNMRSWTAPYNLHNDIMGIPHNHRCETRQNAIRSYAWGAGTHVNTYTKFIHDVVQFTHIQFGSSPKVSGAFWFTLGLFQLHRSCTHCHCNYGRKARACDWCQAWTQRCGQILSVNLDINFG